MSLEDAIAKLTAAVEANTAALAKGGTSAAGGTSKPAAKTAAAGYTAKHTKADAIAAINQVKEEKGVPAAKAIVKALGYEKSSDITKAEDLDKLYVNSQAALGAGNDEGGGGDDEGV